MQTLFLIHELNMTLAFNNMRARYMTSTYYTVLIPEPRTCDNEFFFWRGLHNFNNIQKRQFHRWNIFFILICEQTLKNVDHAMRS